MSVSRESTVRIAIAPAPTDALMAYGISDSISTGASIDLVAAAFSNADYVLGSGKNASRYSNGDWPVLYTARNIDTAVAEKGYWVSQSVFSKSVRPDEVECIEYGVNFEGTGLSVVDTVAEHPLLVHPTDYRHCWEVAKEARNKSVDFLIVPSARKHGGINVNLFRKTSLFEIASCVVGFFRFGSSGTVEYSSSNINCPLVIDDVFSRFS